MQSCERAGGKRVVVGYAFLFVMLLLAAHLDCRVIHATEKRTAGAVCSAGGAASVEMGRVCFLFCFLAVSASAHKVPPGETSLQCHVRNVRMPFHDRPSQESRRLYMGTFWTTRILRSA